MSHCTVFMVLFAESVKHNGRWSKQTNIALKQVFSKTLDIINRIITRSKDNSSSEREISHNHDVTV